MASSIGKSSVSDSRHRITRTNSLGFAKHDCHTCSTLKKHCDRQRPRCGTCISGRRKCGGFAMDLVWKSSAASNNPICSSRGGDIAILGKDFCGRPKKPSQNRNKFKFIQGRPKRKRKPKTLDCNMGQPGTTRGTEPFYPGYQMNFPVSTPSPLPINSGTSGGQPLAPTSVHGELGPCEEELDTFNGNFNNLVPEEFEPAPDGHNLMRGASHSDIHVSSDEDDPNQPTLEEQFPLAHEVCYRDLAHKYSPILTMYDEEFCIIPLSKDCPTNPFRVPVARSEGSKFLLHAILAVSLQHLAKKSNSPALMAEMQRHRSTAFCLFSQALCYWNPVTLLDTLLILINFEETQSAWGMWGAHLNGARKLLENAGALERCQRSSWTRAKVAMLVWWDVTIAFLSRRQPRLHMSYLETLIGDSGNDGWSFFTLNGCPIELVVAMARLAKLAAIYERTTQMEYTIFNRRPVDTVVEEVQNFINEERMTLNEIEQLKEDPNARQDRYHCIEAWRHAILLYTCRVFTSKLDTNRIRLIDHLARVVLDHVRCIPSTATVQKQLLLPVFLAASEVGDEWNRSFALQYCKYWSVVSRFYHFETTAAVLEDIWHDWDPSTRDVHWWGVKVGWGDWVRPDGRDQDMVSELLLG